MSAIRLDPLSRPLGVIRVASVRWDVRAVMVASGVVYLLVYLYALGNLGVQTGLGRDVLVVADPLARMFEPGPGRFTYEPIAIVDLWVVRYLFSPLNTAIGLGLAILVGLNLGLSYLAIVQPRACGIRSGSGLLASLPAVLAGGACCAPVLLLVLGITASGTLMTMMAWMLPVGVLLLVGSLVYLARFIDPATLASA